MKRSNALGAAWLVMAVGIGGTSATAFAQDPPTDPPPPRSFQELDANGDGFVSMDEAAVDPALVQDFARRDADADGKLSEDEFNGSEPAPAEPADPAEPEAHDEDAAGKGD